MTGSTAEPTKNRNMVYMLFALGALLLIAGIYLSTYSTVEMVNQTVNIPYVGSMNVPQPTQVYPYQGIGVFCVVIAILLIIIAIARAR